MKYPIALLKLIESFQQYPGIGPKTAERLAFFTVLELSHDDVRRFSEHLTSALEQIKHCKKCGVLTDKDECDICLDESRENIIVVVEGTKDVNVFEKTNQFHGKYHILNGVISPLNGISPDDINLNSLLKRIEVENTEEIILATGATVEGEMTALYIHNLLKEHQIKVTRIGYGLPAGGDIEYTDEVTLIKALEGRRKM